IELGKLGDTFFVRDDGCGFDMARVGELFTEFKRLHEGSYDGHGIGLAIVKRVIAKHQGTIEAHGEVDRGAE
ncbi:ATP-binding protein, partial [Klebsiella pneumoniae]|uniref:ATP-binding protein n=1 Tax=Klebsiella pneumoniae TaxID=573 RepID=UPI003EE2EE0E